MILAKSFCQKQGLVLFTLVNNDVFSSAGAQVNGYSYQLLMDLLGARHVHHFSLIIHNC